MNYKENIAVALQSIVGNRLRTSLYTFLLINLLLLNNGQTLHAQEVDKATKDTAFVSWVKAHAQQIDNDNLTPVGPIVTDAQVVALGEPAHGFHETLSFRNAMFRFLVEKYKFTTIALEANFAKSHIIADFIEYGTGSAVQAAQALTISDPTTEDIELITWIRQYNQQSNHKVKLKLRGMDMEMLGVPGDTTASHPAIDETLAYLKKTDQRTENHFLAMLSPFLTRMSIAGYAKLSPAEHKKLSGILDDIISTLQRNRSSYITSGKQEAYDWALHCAVVARQTDRMINLLPADIPGKIPPDAWRAASFRDSSMSNNVLWMVEHGEKVFVYAHDIHVKNAVTTGGVWDAFARPPSSTGLYLRVALGNKLRIVGVSFAPSFDIKQPESLEIALGKTGRTNFLINLTTADNTPEVAKWLAALRPMQMNMVTYVNLHLNTAFDAIVYFVKVTSAKRIKVK